MPNLLPKAVSFTLEDVAHFADGSSELPSETADRLRTLIHCDDPEQLEQTWRLIRDRRQNLHQMAEDAGVELWVDAVYVFRSLERLRAEPWETPTEVLDHRVDVPYRELIAMAGAAAKRAEGEERSELEEVAKRLTSVLGEDLGDELIEAWTDRLLEAGEEAAEGALGRLLEVYRQRRGEG